MVPWMGVPGGDEMCQPTIARGWIHQMTCIRELSVHKGQLYQRPLAELKALRMDEQHYHGRTGSAPAIDTRPLELLLTGQAGITVNNADTLLLEWSADALSLSRRSMKNGEWQYRYRSGMVTDLQLVCDHSSVEIFINGGEEVMSSRYFPTHSAQLMLTGDTEVEVYYWSPRQCMVE